MVARSLMVNTEMVRPRQQLSWVLSGCVLILAVSFLTAGAALAQGQWPWVVASKDGTPISYEVFGAGETTLVFVHGWSCDARYWRHQTVPL